MDAEVGQLTVDTLAGAAAAMMAPLVELRADQALARPGGRRRSTNVKM